MDRVGVEIRSWKCAHETTMDHDKEHAMRQNNQSPASAQDGSLVGGIEMQPDMAGVIAHENVARRDCSMTHHGDGLVPSAGQVRAIKAAMAGVETTPC